VSDFLFIDLARLGRTGFWVTARGIGRALLYFVLTIVVSVAVLVPLAIAFPGVKQVFDGLQTGKAGVGVEMAAVALQAAVVLWAVRDMAVRTCKRPFMTLVSAAGRLDIQRIAIGMGAWLVAMAVSALLLGLVFHDADSPSPVWHAPGPDWYLAAVLGLVVVPLQAGGEELLFRGWLTQMIGQGIRNRIVLALVVALLFALAHGFAAGPLAVPYFMIASLGLSAVTLKDQRLELAIGGHTAQNLFVLLVATPFLEGGGSPTLLGSGEIRIGVTALASAALQAALFYVISTARSSRQSA
jgi:membrane protease YdiL (CAAX protease family)